MKNQSHKTAIRRNKLSAPARFLLNKNLIKGKILDYGCGRGDDVEQLANLNIIGWDPYWNDHTKHLKRKFDTILCTYVVCVIEPEKRIKILGEIKSLLTKNGKAYITVRRDIKQDTVTKNNTKQWVVKLNLPVVVKNNSFCIYEVSREK